MRYIILKAVNLLLNELRLQQNANISYVIKPLNSTWALIAIIMITDVPPLWLKPRHNVRCMHTGYRSRQIIRKVKMSLHKYIVCNNNWSDTRIYAYVLLIRIAELLHMIIVFTMFTQINNNYLHVPNRLIYIVTWSPWRCETAECISVRLGTYVCKYISCVAVDTIGRAARSTLT